MLNIMDPVALDDLVLFRDDEDPRKFYLLPDRPVIPTNERGAPDFLFIRYINDASTTAEGQEPGGGYVQFRTVLSLDPARKQRVMDALRARLDEEKAAGKKPFGREISATEPLLASPIWTHGEVAMQTFGVSDAGLVRHATSTAPVDLAGALGASVNLELDARGADVFWDSFKQYKERQVPIIITYSLTYKARVSATMEIHAERSTIEKHIWERANPLPYGFLPILRRWVPLPFTGVFNPAILAGLRASLAGRYGRIIAGAEPGKIQKAIESAVTEGAVTVRIETDQAGAGGQGASGDVQKMLIDAAIKVLTDRVIPALFGDAPAQPASKDEQDTAIDKMIVELKIDAESTTKTTFDVNLDSTSTIELPCNPNGPIHLLIPDAELLGTCFRELRLADGFFTRMRVTAATSGINFERDGIEAVHVYLRYSQVDGSSPDRRVVERLHDAVLRSEADTVHWQFDMVRDARGALVREYEFRTDVRYGDILLKSDWSRTTNSTLEITPAAMGAVRVDLALTAPREQVSQARVSLRYERREGDVLADEITLTPDANRTSWFRSTGELESSGAPARPHAYSYRITYVTAGGEVTTPWTTSTSEQLEIPSPFTKVASFILKPQGSFDGVSSIAGDALYEDAARGYRIRKDFTLDKLSASVRIDVPILSGGPEEITYTARINRVDGAATPLPPGRGAAGTVWIGETVTDYLEVQVLPDLLDFDKDVQLAVVQLRHADSDGDDQKTMTFSKAAKAAQSWKVALGPTSPRRYGATIRYVAYDRAKSSEVRLENLEDAVLVLDRAAP